jgi:ribosomal protein S18 acetylase RimI-like enzyme
MYMQFAIRDARAGDERAVVTMIGELAEGECGYTKLTEAYVKEYLAYPGNSVILAESEDGRVLGLASLSLRPDLFHAAISAEITEVVVTKSARKQGVGSALIKEVMGRAGELSCAEICVSTMADNAAAIRLYKRNGLTEEAVALGRHFQQT